MSDHDHHCPFLNRSDARCSNNFSLERLHNTYDFCFGNYARCSVYLELLVERRLRRARQAAGVSNFGQRPSLWADEHEEAQPAPSRRLVALTHAGRPIAAHG